MPSGQQGPSMPTLEDAVRPTPRDVPAASSVFHFKQLFERLNLVTCCIRTRGALHKPKASSFAHRVQSAHEIDLDAIWWAERKRWEGFWGQEQRGLGLRGSCHAAGCRPAVAALLSMQRLVCLLPSTSNTSCVVQSALREAGVRLVGRCQLE